MMPGPQEFVSLGATLILEVHRNLFRLFGDRTLLVPEPILAAIGGEVAGMTHPAAGGAVISMFCSGRDLRASDEFVTFERARHRMQHRYTPPSMIDIAPDAGNHAKPLRGTR